MQFNSIEFLFYFLPIFLALYRLIPRQGRLHILVLGSLVYYYFAGNGNLWWLILLAGVTVFGYLAGLTLNGPNRGKLLAAYLVFLGLFLTFFKLVDGGRYLPSGMSFYIFQVAAYMIDVYRKWITPETKPGKFFAEIFMFPKLLSGPLMGSRELKIQIRTGDINGKNIRDGLQLLIIGLGLKVILANRLGGFWAEAGIVGYESISTAFAWFALIAYAMQLYFDFYGYSLMAMGLGKMLGFDLPRNFDSPYASKSVSEFYRRWHATLGNWFRQYLYIPLGGNRKGQIRTVLNIAVVWLFTGLWHGVGGNYLIWAGFLFLLIVNERMWLGKLLNRSRVLCHVYVVFMILLSWVPFAVGQWDQMVLFIGRLFGILGETINPTDYIDSGSGYAALMCAGVLLATPLPRKLWEKIRHSVAADLLILALFWIVVYFISTAAQDPFMYFQY